MLGASWIAEKTDVPESVVLAVCKNKWKKLLKLKIIKNYKAPWHNK